VNDDRCFVGIDVGSASVKVVVAVPEPHRLVVKGCGEARHDGARRGIIAALEEVTGAVRAAAEEAEAMASVPVELASVALGGTPVRGTPSTASTPVTGRNHTVSRDDVTLALARCAEIGIPAEYRVLDIIPCGFALDGQPGLENPEGMTGRRLDATAYVLFTTNAHADTVEQAVNQAAVKVTDLWYEPLAAAEAVLSRDEREFGCLLLDIGHATSEWILWRDGTVAAGGVFPVGGRHFTADLATVIQTTTGGAEKIKRQVGVSLDKSNLDLVAVEVPTLSGHGNQIIEGTMAANVLYERAQELFVGVARELATMELDRVPRAGVVLTGGGALLDGMEEVAEAIFGHHARVGSPRDLAGEVEPVAGPQWAVAIGLVRLAHRRRLQNANGRSAGSGLMGRLRWALGELFDLGGGHDLHR
jgi:cell division protein FtsA